MILGEGALSLRSRFRQQQDYLYRSTRPITAAAVHHPPTAAHELTTVSNILLREFLATAVLS